jgi:UDP:flavonoid glycosyltransferase YjiC (YdhE family)
VSNLDNPDILFISRGRGRGHAVPDLSIAREIRARRPRASVRFCSYGTGALVLRNAGEDVIALEAGDMDPPWKIHIELVRLLATIAPRLVVSHEEFVAVPAATIFRLPTVFLTHWFFPSPHLMNEAIGFARSIGFLETEGAMISPSTLQGKIVYLGPVLRQFRYLPRDRRALREEMGFGDDELVLGVFPGTTHRGMMGEHIRESMRLTLNAFHELPVPAKAFLLIGGAVEELLGTDHQIEKIITVESHPHPEAMMIVSDVAITTGSYAIGAELMALGVPSISLSGGLNQIDDFFAKRRRNNRFLYYKEATSAQLAEIIVDAVRTGPAEPETACLLGTGAARVAEYIVQHLSQVSEDGLDYRASPA